MVVFRRKRRKRHAKGRLVQFLVAALLLVCVIAFFASHGLPEPSEPDLRGHLGSGPDVVHPKERQHPRADTFPHGHEESHEHKHGYKEPLEHLEHRREPDHRRIVPELDHMFGDMHAFENLNRLRHNGKSDVQPHAMKDHVAAIDMRELAHTLPFDNPDGGPWKQGWEIEPVLADRSHPLNIFVVPHSHCDPGWIKTFDTYFQGQVKQILTTIFEALSKNSKRRFIWAEISYFEWWWNEQSSDKREQVRKMLESGQFEFVTGGWVQSDEANTQLYAMEIQLQEGHDWIRETFGERFLPKYGWSIDPFGYSPTMAYLLKKFNFEAMLIQRVHYAVKKELASRQHLEFMWRQTWDETGEHDIFCHVMPFFSYDVPHTCGPDPSVCCQFDFARITHSGANSGSCPWHKQPKKISASNIHERSMLLLDQYMKKAALYRSNSVLIPLGDDFRYERTVEAEDQFENYQKMFDYINSEVPGVNVQFATLSEYFKAIKGTFDPPMLKGSFFTYADVDEDYWSGYFTSRVFDKALDRELERAIYAATSMGATKQELQQPRRALSLFQHHDGVTGTAKSFVVQDYAKRIQDAIQTTQQWISANIEAQFPEAGVLDPCWVGEQLRGMKHNTCTHKQVYLYNPLETPQFCGHVEVRGKQVATVAGELPCETPGSPPDSRVQIEFDPNTGLMVYPFREEWKVWKVHRGGAYLFFPGNLVDYSERVEIKEGGYVVESHHWTRRVVERRVPTEFGAQATVIDFIFETNLQEPNQEWFVRFTGDVNNKGTFHTDLNGFNFDTHHFRKDMPIQSQVFPMPTLASIEDENVRMTILSEHAQGTASLEEGSIDVWLDRRLSRDDSRGLGEGVMDNVQTRTRLRVLLEHEGYNPEEEFTITPLCERMWDELNHPLEMFGARHSKVTN